MGWNLKATFTVDQNTNEKLTIAVFDEDFGKDDSLGITSLDLSSIQNCRRLENEWIPLEKCKSGEILLSAEFIPSGNIQTESKKEPIQEIAPKKKIEGEKPKEDVQVTSPLASKHKIMEKGQIVITVFKAKDIEKKGMFGKADPYIKMTLGKQKAKSLTVKNNHNPEWNLKATFDVDHNTTEKVSIAIFDEDFGKDDSLGSTSLDIFAVQKHKKLLNQWLPLEKCKSGEVLLSAEFIPINVVDQQRSLGN